MFDVGLPWLKLSDAVDIPKYRVEVEGYLVSGELRRPGGNSLLASLLAKSFE